MPLLQGQTGDTEEGGLGLDGQPALRLILIDL
jgi:hypothetical protein